MVDHYQLGRRGIQTGTSASQITAAYSLSGPGQADGLDRSCYILISSGARLGDISRLSAKPVLSTGVATVSPNFSGALSSGDRFIVFFEPLGIGDPTSAGATAEATTAEYDILSAINQARAEFPWEKRQVVYSGLANGGDMVSSTTSEFTNGGSATLAKNIATLTLPRYLSLTGSGSSQYVEATNISVKQGESYYTEVMAAKGSASNGTWSVRNVTDGGTYTLQSSSIDERTPIILADNLSMTSTCEQISLRVAKADGGGTQTILVFHMICYKNGSRVLTLQDRPQRPIRLGQLKATTNTNYELRSFDSMTPVNARPTETDGIWQYHLEDGISGAALYYEEFVKPAALSLTSSGSAFTDTYSTPTEDLAAVAADYLLRPLSSSPRWSAKAAQARLEAARVRKEWTDALFESQPNAPRVFSMSYVG